MRRQRNEFNYLIPTQLFGAEKNATMERDLSDGYTLGVIKPIIILSMRPCMGKGASTC